MRTAELSQSQTKGTDRKGGEEATSNGRARQDLKYPTFSSMLVFVCVSVLSLVWIWQSGWSGDGVAWRLSGSATCMHACKGFAASRFLTHPGSTEKGEE